MSVYAARIRAARGYADITQEQLADALGVDVQTIKRREAGKKEPKKGELLAIAAICGVPPEFMDRGFGAPLAGDAGSRLDAIERLLLDHDGWTREQARKINHISTPEVVSLGRDNSKMLRELDERVRNLAQALLTQQQRDTARRKRGQGDTRSEGQDDQDAAGG